MASVAVLVSLLLLSGNFDFKVPVTDLALQLACNLTVETFGTNSKRI